MVWMQLGDTAAVGMLEVNHAAFRIQSQLIVERDEIGIVRPCCDPW